MSGWSAISYERDFAAAAPGAAATVTFSAYPDLQLAGKVGYIDPQVKTDTRTAQLRVEVTKPEAGQLRLGMLGEVRISDSRASAALTIPRTAVQTVGDLYVCLRRRSVRDPTRFVERQVQVDAAGGAETVRVLAGLETGEVVVGKGSFALRAERDRNSFPTARVWIALPNPLTQTPTAAPVQTARIQVTDQGGTNLLTVSLKAGVPARLTFVRISERTCGTEVLFPSLNIRKTLPFNEPVDIDFMPRTGDIEFACGMAMLEGALEILK